MSDDQVQTIGLLGFGEVGQRLADDLAPLPDVRLRAYDIRFDAPDSGPRRALGSRPCVEAAASAIEMADGCQLVVSAVTAGAAVEALATIAPALAPGAFVLDVNSVSPASRRRSAAIVASVGGRYVEAAVMSPIAPLGVRSPMFLGGPHAEAFSAASMKLGFSGASICAAEIGVASAAKLCRSVIIKGLEALFTESLLAARHYGVEDRVLRSLDDLLGERNWAAFASYLVGRSLEHGTRRAEEMLEAAATLADAGVVPWMSRACVERQHQAARCGPPPADADLAALLDLIRGSGQQMMSTPPNPRLR